MRLEAEVMGMRAQLAARDDAVKDLRGRVEH
jgi:hypothetical protein